MSSLPDNLPVEGKKYELVTSEQKVVAGRTLYRIRAVRDFGKMTAGSFGGFVESESNLSHSGVSWVADDACVYDQAVVSGDAQVFGRAHVYDRARISDKAQVLGNAQIFDDGWVHKRGVVFDNARVFGHGQVRDDALVYGSAVVCDRARVLDHGQVCDSRRVDGETIISGPEKLTGPSSDVPRGKRGRPRTPRGPHP